MGYQAVTKVEETVSRCLDGMLASGDSDVALGLIRFHSTRWIRFNVFQLSGNASLNDQ
jgi:hypothetical protein